VAPWSVGILSNYTQTALLFLVDSRTSVHLKYSERNTQTGHLISFTTDGLHKGGKQMSHKQTEPMAQNQRWSQLFLQSLLLSPPVTSDSWSLQTSAPTSACNVDAVEMEPCNKMKQSLVRAFQLTEINGNQKSGHFRYKMKQSIFSK